ncbi:MAG: hypothetical protein MZV65_52840 [Chromatiales bacterium]|nr:hypothetical protein [Chromatiales bacterium]
MQAAVLAVSFRRPPGPAALATLAGVQDIETADDGSLRLYYDPAADPTDALVRLAVEQRLGPDRADPAARRSSRTSSSSLTTGRCPDTCAGGRTDDRDTIARHELRRLFLVAARLDRSWRWCSSSSPTCSCSHLDYYTTVQSQLLGMDGDYGVTETIVAPLFANAAIVLLLVVPLTSMRLVTEERRNKTLALLFSAPLSHDRDRARQVSGTGMRSC